MQWTGIVTEDLPEMYCSPGDAVQYAVLPGDLLVCEGGDAGRAAILGDGAPRGTIIQNSLHRVRPRQGLSSRYLLYVLTTIHASGWLEALCNRATIAHLTSQKLAALRIPAPPLSEQCAIAAFLDRETARIDEMVSIQRRLLDRLNERRHAAIYARIAGQDSGVPRKTACLPWLTSAPSHWDVAPLYSRYSVQLGKMLDAARISGDHLAPYLRNLNVQWDRLDLTNLLEMDFDAGDRVRYTLRTGDLLVCEGGEVGRAAIWQGQIAEYYYQKALHRLRSRRPGEEPRYLLYVLWAAANMGVFVAEGNPNTFDHLTAEKLRRHRFPFPPPAEQREIVAELDTCLQTIRMTEDGVSRQIALLQEHRQALITAVVTGQIDLRDDG